MLVNLFFIILGAGTVLQLVPKNRLPVLWSTLSVAAVSYCIYQVYLLGATPDVHIVYPWLKIPNLAIGLEMVVNSENVYIVLSLMLLALLALLQNTFSNDTAKNSLNGLVLFNLLSALMLVFSNNYIQMLVAIGVCDVLVFSAINDVVAKKKFIYGNFLADVGIVSLFAVVLGQSGNIDLQSLANYSRFGHHKDFVAILLLICIFIKSGLFLFHGTYTDMRLLGFNRLNFILFMATPLTGYLLLLKCEALLSISTYSYPLLQIFAVLSIVWGFLGVLLIDNIKQKAIYLALMFWGLVYAFAATGHRLAALDFAALLTAAFLFNQILVFVNMAASNVSHVSEMGGFLRSLKFTFALGIIVYAVYMSAILMLMPDGLELSLGYVILLTLATSHVFSQIMLGSTHADERVLAMLKNPPLMVWMPSMVSAFALLYYFRVAPIYLLPVMIVALFLFLVRPLRFLDKVYNWKRLQNADYITAGYELLLITPVKVVGRLLWLAVDFIFIERTIINSIQHALRFMIFVFRRIHSGTLTASLLFVLLGFAIIFAVWLHGGR